MRLIEFCLGSWLITWFFGRHVDEDLLIYHNMHQSTKILDGKYV